MYGSNASSTTTKFVPVNQGDAKDTISNNLDVSQDQEPMVFASSSDPFVSRQRSGTNGTYSDKVLMMSKIPSNLQILNTSSEAKERSSKQK